MKSTNHMNLDWQICIGSFHSKIILHSLDNVVEWVEMIGNIILLFHTWVSYLPPYMQWLNVTIFLFFSTWIMMMYCMSNIVFLVMESNSRCLLFIHYIRLFLHAHIYVLDDIKARIYENLITTFWVLKVCSKCICLYTQCT